MLTISYELAEKLENLGFRKFARFEWLHLNYEDKESIKLVETGGGYHLFSSTVANYAAYTLDEILKILPFEITIDEKQFCLRMQKENNVRCYYDFYYAYVLERTPTGIATEEIGSQENDNPTECAGELLLWCLEYGHIKSSKQV